MTVEIYAGKAKGSIKAPPSKSMSHRYLIAAALAKGISKIEGIAYSEDVLATLDCLEALGIKTERDGNTVTVYGGTVSAPQKPLFCRESGSTLRFLLPICWLFGKNAELAGSKRLMERPLSVYEAIAKEEGFSFSFEEGKIMTCGSLTAGDYHLDGSISSQFITGLLFALSAVSGTSRLFLSGKIESRSYIDLTIEALHAFGFRVDWQNSTVLIIEGAEGSAREILVEGDYSNAAFFEALNCLGGCVQVEGLREDSLQGDRVYRLYFEKLKAGCPTLSLADCPDLGPVLFALAAALNGAEFVDTARLKIKESDRGAAMARELKKCGVPVLLEENRIVVSGGMLQKPKEVIEGHNDHRIVMAMAVLLTCVGGKIEGAEAVAKSMPDFFEKLSMVSKHESSEPA